MRYIQIYALDFLFALVKNLRNLGKFIAPPWNKC